MTRLLPSTKSHFGRYQVQKYTLSELLSTSPIYDYAT